MIPVASAEPESTDPLVSLTGALVDANDRLLGLLSLITSDAPTSLDAAQMVDSIAERAASILELDQVALCGVENHTWTTTSTTSSTSFAGTWSTSVAVDEIGELEFSFARLNRTFDTGDTKLLAAVARLMANAVATAHVHRKTLAQEVVAREHATAAAVAAAALPDPASMPQREGLTFFAHLTPARETGGDLFTWQEIDECVWFAIGDVSGKGLPAAVLMSTAVSAIDASMTRSHHGGPAAVAAAVDRWLYQRLSDAAMFVTLAIGQWNSETAQLTVANCGHSPILWCTDSGAIRVDATAPPIGVLPDCAPSPWTCTTTTGDALILATDGFTEQPDRSGQMFGEDHFDARAVEARALGDATLIGASLLDQIERHGQDCPQSDDRALMVLGFS